MNILTLLIIRILCHWRLQCSSACSPLDYTSLISLHCSKTCCPFRQDCLGRPSQDAALFRLLHHHHHHHNRQQPQFLSSREPFTVLTGSHWCGAAFTAPNSTVCCSLATHCTHKRHGVSAGCRPHRKVHTGTGVFFFSLSPLQHTLHTTTGVFAHGDIAHLLRFSPPPSLYPSSKGEGKSSRRSVATALRRLLQRRES